MAASIAKFPKAEGFRCEETDESSEPSLGFRVKIVPGCMSILESVPFMGKFALEEMAPTYLGLLFNEGRIGCSQIPVWEMEVEFRMAIGKV